jgi:type I restriction enzyme R subunit
VPQLQAAGWEDDPHLIQVEKSFTDGRIAVAAGKAKRHKRKRGLAVARQRSFVE